MQKVFCVLLTIIFSFGLCCQVFAQQANERFNEYINRAIDEVLVHRKNGGYQEKGAAFTRPLHYGPHQSAIPALKPSLTMCVAAVGEAMVEGLNLYYANKPENRTPFDQLKAAGWDNKTAPVLGFVHFLFTKEFCTCTGRRLAVANGMHNYDCTRDFLRKLGQKESNNPRKYSNDTYVRRLASSSAEAFVLFGIGRQLTHFSQLRKGDFVNYSRANLGGHAVIFRSFISASKGETDKYTTESDIIGFRYFSAQHNGTNGLGEKFGYFEGKCPEKPNPLNDCQIVKRTVFMGYLLHPNYWKTEAAQARLAVDLRAKDMTGCTYPKGLFSKRREQILQSVLRQEGATISLLANRPNDLSPQELVRVQNMERRFTEGFIRSIVQDASAQLAPISISFDGNTPLTN